jgi:hypothetical protein
MLLSRQRTATVVLRHNIWEERLKAVVSKAAASTEKGALATGELPAAAAVGSAGMSASCLRLFRLLLALILTCVLWAPHQQLQSAPWDDRDNAKHIGRTVSQLEHRNTQVRLQNILIVRWKWIMSCAPYLPIGWPATLYITCTRTCLHEFVTIQTEFSLVRYARPNLSSW